MANVNRLKQVRMAIVNFEENFHYQNFFTDKETVLAIDQCDADNIFTHDCGTCACVAGFVVALHPNESPLLRWRGISYMARYLLDLTFEESEWLFCPMRHPDYELDIESVKGFEYDPDFLGYEFCTQKEGYIEALRRLDHLIEYYSNNG